MKVEDARKLEAEIKKATAEFNRVVRSASLLGLIVEVRTTHIQYLPQECETPILHVCVKIKPSEVDL